MDKKQLQYDFEVSHVFSNMKSTCRVQKQAKTNIFSNLFTKGT